MPWASKIYNKLCSPTVVVITCTVIYIKPLGSMEFQLHVNIAITWTTIPFVRVHYSLLSGWLPIHIDRKWEPQNYKMLSVPFVFSMSRFQGPAFRCDKIVVIVTLVRCIAGSVGLMFAILRILRKARGNGGYSMFRETYLRATTYEWTFYRESKRTYIKTIFTSISCKT